MHLLTILLSLLTITSCQEIPANNINTEPSSSVSDTLYFKDLKVDQEGPGGRHYFSINGISFTGVAINPQEGANGGMWKFIYNVEKGRANRMEVYRPDGNLERFVNMKEGFSHGQCLMFNENNILYVEQYSDMGNKIGNWKVWAPDGSLKKEEYFGPRDLRKNPEPSFFAIVVKDFKKSVAYYTDLLGFDVDSQSANQERGLKQVNLSRGSCRIELIEVSQSIDPKINTSNSNNIIQGIFKIGLIVEDFDTWYQVLNDRGAKLKGEIVVDPVTNNNMFIILDPDGNRIQFFEK